MQLPPELRDLSPRSFYRLATSRHLSARAQRRVADAASAITRAPGTDAGVAGTLGGRPARRWGPTGRGAILYLHGGGFVLGSPRMYRSLAAHLAAAADRAVHVLDYRLAPENPHPAALDDALAAARDLDGPLALCGDSAGGGLAVSLARALTDEGRPPVALGLHSPWTDLADDTLADRDLVLTRRWLAGCVADYRGDHPADDPRISPARGPLGGLPPTLVQYAADELLADQIRRFCTALEQAGVEVSRAELPDLWHSAQQLAGLVRGADDAVAAAGRFLRDHLLAAGA